eukprot:636561-Prymnesium_polylepis.1
MKGKQNEAAVLKPEGEARAWVHSGRRRRWRMWCRQAVGAAGSGSKAGPAGGRSGGGRPHDVGVGVRSECVAALRVVVYGRRGMRSHPST